jgi:hypothetical protein
MLMGWPRRHRRLSCATRPSPSAFDHGRFSPGTALGDRAGSFSIRVNDQYRITFRFEGADAHDVRCEDCH